MGITVQRTGNQRLYERGVGDIGCRSDGEGGQVLPLPDEYIVSVVEAAIYGDIAAHIEGVEAVQLSNGQQARSNWKLRRT